MRNSITKFLTNIGWVGAVLLASIMGTKAFACEHSENSSPVNLEQANQQLMQTLFAQGTPEESNLDEQLKSIDCSLIPYPDLAEVRSQLSVLANNLVGAQGEQQIRSAIADINQAVNRDAGSGFVILPKDSSSQEFDLYGLLSQACTEQATEECSAALFKSQTLWKTAGQFRSFADQFNNSDKSASLAYNDMLEQKWNSYKDDTILLWPQEVLLNSLVFKPSERGLSEPPSFKLLSLRPSLGLTYLSDQSHHVQPTINLDLLGIYWWEYAGAKAKPGRGVSTSLVWDGSDTALGLTYHHNPKWSVTLASSDEDDIVVSISLQLARYLIK